MLEGFVPFPEEFVKRYKEKGYWIGKTLGEEFDEAVAKYGDRVALTCNGEYVTYRELGERATRLALHFIERGLRPYDRMILQLPNELEFAYVYFAAVKIGVIPIMALPVHRDAEIGFFAQFTKAKAHVIPSAFKDFSHQAMSREIRKKRRPWNSPLSPVKRSMETLFRFPPCSPTKSKSGRRSNP